MNFDDDDFDNMRKKNQQALMKNLLPQLYQNPITPEQVLGQTQELLPDDLLPDFLKKRGWELRPHLNDYIVPDGKGGMARLSIEIINRKSACGCILSEKNPPYYICQDCKKEICGSNGCSATCVKCSIRLCRKCFHEYQNKAYCRDCYPSILEMIFG